MLAEEIAGKNPKNAAAAIRMIIDRGHGDPQKLARSMTVLAGLQIVKIVQKSFDRASRADL